MLGYSRWALFKGLVAAVGTLSVVSLLLIYFIPAPPSKVTISSAFKGSSVEYYARQYREIFARSNVELELRETAGSLEDVKLLQDPQSGVQIALVVGGVSDGKHAPGLLSLGTVARRRGYRITTFFAAAQNVCFWHKADIKHCPTDVRFWG